MIKYSRLLFEDTNKTKPWFYYLFLLIKVKQSLGIAYEMTQSEELC